MLPFEFNSGLFARDAAAAFGAGFATGFTTGFGADFGARVSLVEDLFDFVDEDFVQPQPGANSYSSFVDEMD